VSLFDKRCDQCKKGIEKDGWISCYSINLGWAFCTPECEKDWFSISKNVIKWQERERDHEYGILAYGCTVKHVDEKNWPHCKKCGQPLTWALRSMWVCGVCNDGIDQGAIE
jgi:hypothetical protein